MYPYSSEHFRGLLYNKFDTGFFPDVKRIERYRNFCWYSAFVFMHTADVPCSSAQSPMVRQETKNAYIVAPSDEYAAAAAAVDANTGAHHQATV